MSNYILEYIDSKEQRTRVQRSLNRGESYHQLTAAITKIGGYKQLKGKNELELQINAESIRFLANIIIYHNATILSELYQYYKSKDPKKSNEILHWSPIAWRFINMIGKYEFYKKGEDIDIQSITNKIIKEFEIQKSQQT